MKINLLIILTFLLIAACSDESTHKEQHIKKDYVKVREIADLWFHHSAEMEACFIQTYKMAQLALDEQLANYKNEKKPAVVLDLDETVLNNSPYQFKLLEVKKEYTYESWTDWVNLAKAEALPGAYKFVSYAKEKGVEVFYISNRTVAHLEATIKNLQRLSFPNADSIHVLLNDKTSDKTERRAIVSENYEIIMLIGDNLTDMSQKFADRNKETMGKEIVEQNKALIGEKYIVMPNPMYGEWEKAIYNNSRKWSDAQKDSLRKLVIKSGY